MSLWRKTRLIGDGPKFKSGGVVPDARLARSAATGEAVVPEVLTAYTQQLVSKKTVLAQLGIEPNFDGVGDTMGFDSDPGSFETGVYSQGGPLMECVWCGSYGTHKPDCKALSRNYPKSSLGTQREMTERLRSEMDRQTARTYYQGSGAGGNGGPGVAGVAGVTMKPEPPKDERTELQKRFDAIAEELKDGGK